MHVSRRITFAATGACGLLLAGAQPFAHAASGSIPRQTAACDVAVDTRYPEEIVRGQPDRYMVVQMRVNTCQQYSYMRITNTRAVGRTSCGARFNVLVLSDNHLLQAFNCPSAGTSVNSITDGNSSARLHWGSLRETIAGKTYVACVDEYGQGRCR